MHVRAFDCLWTIAFGLDLDMHDTLGISCYNTAQLGSHQSWGFPNGAGTSSILSTRLEETVPFQTQLEANVNINLSLL